MTDWIRRQLSREAAADPEKAEREAREECRASDHLWAYEPIMRHHVHGGRQVLNPDQDLAGTVKLRACLRCKQVEWYLEGVRQFRPPQWIDPLQDAVARYRQQEDLNE